MDASKAAQIKAHARAIAELLYGETDPKALETFEGIELSVRTHILEQIGPEIGEFFVKQQVEPVEAANGASKVRSETSKSRNSKRKS
jgi:hypothetical protein